MREGVKEQAADEYEVTAPSAAANEDALAVAVIVQVPAVEEAENEVLALEGYVGFVMLADARSAVIAPHVSAITRAPKTAAAVRLAPAGALRVPMKLQDRRVPSCTVSPILRICCCASGLPAP
jgi:hypothetical protein